MPTHSDFPWLRDARRRESSPAVPGEATARLRRLEPDDPHLTAALHESRQAQAIDQANRATSTPPPPAP